MISDAYTGTTERPLTHRSVANGFPDDVLSNFKGGLLVDVKIIGVPSSDIFSMGCQVTANEADS